MSDKKVPGFVAPTDGQANDDAKLMVLSDPSTGLLYKPEVSQMKKTFGTYKVKYVATGSEGVTLTIAVLAAMSVLSVSREGADLYEVASAPDSVSYIWDNTNITLGLATNAGERFNILYKNY